MEMTREEAIDQLCEMGNVLQIIPNSPKGEALKMAIKALEQEPCEDTISRKSIMERLNNAKMFFDYEGADPFDKGRKNGIIDAMDIVADEPPVYPKLETGHWIPVSKKLPEKNMTCLVAVGKFNLTQMAMYSDLMGIVNHRIFYQGDCGNDNFENITQYVNAWMPLPEPYKAESEGKE